MLHSQAAEVSLGTKEIRDLTRMERIGAHSHIRGNSITIDASFNDYINIIVFCTMQVWVLTMLWNPEKSLKEWWDRLPRVELVVLCIR